MRKQFNFIFTILCLALIVCSVSSAQDIKTNYMPETDFSQFHTYKWITIAGAVNPNQIVDQEIRDAINAQLAAKGLSKTDSDSADLFIGYQCAVQQEKQWNAWGMGGGLRWGGMGQATQSTIATGTLVLDMYSSQKKQLVWEGVASKTLDPGSNAQKKQNNINKAMAKLLKNYPPKQK